MKTYLRTSENGSKTLYVLYKGDEFNEAMEAALNAYNLKQGQVSVIAIPAGSKLWKGK